MARAARKTRSDDGTREPRSEMTASAKAISVAAGIAQPCALAPGLNARNIRAGTAMPPAAAKLGKARRRSEEHTSELQSLMRISYAVFCLKKTKQKETSKAK